MSTAGDAVIETGGRPGQLPRLLSVTEHLQIHEDHARRNIAYLVVAGYLGVLAINVVPVGVYLATHHLSVQDVKDLATTMAILVSSVTGVVGFVLGYYFKSGERQTSTVESDSA